jgi:Mrp family chromosome partitioning ATPase
VYSNPSNILESVWKVFVRSFPPCIPLSEYSFVDQSRSTGFTSAAHGLPPLSAFFVARESVIKQMVSALLDNQDQESTQRIMVISGMAGSGKTQVTLKFAREFEDR